MARAMTSLGIKLIAAPCRPFFSSRAPAVPLVFSAKRQQAMKRDRAVSTGASPKRSLVLALAERNVHTIPTCPVWSGLHCASSTRTFRLFNSNRRHHIFAGFLSNGVRMQSIMFPASDSITLPQDVRSGWDAKPSLCRVKGPWLKPFSHSECGIYLTYSNVRQM